MSRTKGARDKKPRKREIKVRDTFGYILRWQIKKGEVNCFMGDKTTINKQKLKQFRIKMLLKQLDCIRRVPEYKLVGRRCVILNPPRSRVVLKRPVPAEEGKYAHYWYRRRVSKLMIKLWGRDITQDENYEEKLRDMRQNMWASKYRFYQKVLYKAVCRMMEQENEKKMAQRPYKTERQVLEELHKLGVYGWG